MYLQGVAQVLRRLVQLFNRQVELVGDEKIQPENVVQRLRHFAAIDEPPRLQLVALPRLADCQAQQKTDECGDKRCVSAQNNPVRHRSCRWRPPSTCKSLPATTSDVIFRCSM